MRWLRELLFVTFLLVNDRTLSKEIRKKQIEGFKRAVETYTYTPGRYNQQSGDVKGEVIVETIKSISPSEYLTSSGFLGSTFEANTPTGKVPLGSVSFNAFEPESTKKEQLPVSASPTETSVILPKKSSFKVYVASSSTQNSVPSIGSGSSTISSAPVRKTSVESATTLYPTYQINSHSSSISEPINLEKGLKIITTRRKIGNEKYTLQKIIKKPTKIEPKIFDSKPEETGLKGYHYDVGFLDGFEAKHSGSKGGGGGGMMGASYMRSSSPFYNYHVMLD